VAKADANAAVQAANRHISDGMKAAGPKILKEAGSMGSYVETWKAIAYSCSRSERWCRYMARRGMDPLPVYKVGGIVRMNLPDLDAWLQRQRGVYLAA
jgi:hypothetical protein